MGNRRILRFLRIALLACAVVLVRRDVTAQTNPWLAWDEHSVAPVTGYAVSIDGVRVDYGLSPLNSNLTCGCSVALPFSGGSHSLTVSAYNPFGETWSSALTVGPVANAGGPYTGAPRFALSVDGSGSNNPTGTIATYSWDWGDGSARTISSSSKTTHTYAVGGKFTLTLTVTDNAGANAVATTTATVTAENPPVATDDSASVRRKDAVTIPVLQNDSDIDADPLQIVSASKPSRGSVQVIGGMLTYTPTNGPVGLVTFTYTISDGRGGTATATVSVTVMN
jgi:hypothetical protein